MAQIILTIATRSPLLSSNKLNRISEIAADMAQIFFASMVIPFFVDIDKTSSPMLVLGTVLSLSFWTVSVAVTED